MVSRMTGMAVLTAAVAISTSAAGADLAPAERCDVHEWQKNWRVLVRFDLARVTNAAKITKATLSVAGVKEAGALEVRPVTTDWGGLSAAFRKRELEGVWRPQDLKGEGYKHARDLWLLGEADWTNAVRGVKTWATPGGDFGPIVATLPKKGSDPQRKRGQTPFSADVTALVKQWLAKPAADFGLVVKEAAEADRKAALRGAVVTLTLEGPGVAVDDALRINDQPAWLPKTYKVDHPRLPYPTEEWLAALKADPKRLAAVCRAADAFNPEKGRAASLDDLVIAQRLAPTPARRALITKAIDAAFPNHGGFAVCYGLATLYDWGYDLLTPAERRRLAWRLERMCLSQEEGSSSTIISPYNDVGTSRFGCGLLWAALAIYPDIPGARKHVWRAKSYYIDTSIPVWHQVFGDDGGYWHELHGYYLSTCIGNALARVLSSWTSATGEDLYRKHPWLENWLYFGIYSTRPDMYRLRSGDIKCDERGYGEPPISLYSFPALAKRYDNPHGRWWLTRTGRTRLDGVSPTEDPWGEPFRKGAAVKAWDTLPLVRHADGFGMVNMRSDWTEDATYVWFRCGPNFWSHSHLDSGSFVIYKRGALAIDAGNYTAGHNCEHYLLYGKMSIAHNVVTVTDPDEPAVTRGDWTFPNDGGQRFVVAGCPGTPAPYSVAEWNKRREEFDTGRIIAFQTTKDFTYVCGDVTKAYTNGLSGTGHLASRSKRVRKCIRSLVFLPPDHVVVFDRVESFNKAFRKRWLLHTINEPKMVPRPDLRSPPGLRKSSGASKTSEVAEDLRSQGNPLITVERADLCFRFSAWDKGLKHAITAEKDHPFYREHPDCRWYGGYQPQLYQYDGVMFVNTLLPKDAEVTVVGGPGRECWFNGRNYVRNTRGKPITFRPHTGEGEAGRYRIEISPRAPAENDLFLNVIQVGLKSEGAKPTPVELIEEDGMVGATISHGGGALTRVLFKEGGGGKIVVQRMHPILGPDGSRTDTGRVREYDLAETVLPNPKIER